MSTSGSRKRSTKPTRRRRTFASAVISTKGLTKHFGPVKAVQDLDLQVRRGEIFGYLGPNGAGKTTTIRLLLDFLRPTKGDVTILGTSPKDAQLRRRIGYMPSDLNLDPKYTGNDVFSFFGSLRGSVDATWIKDLLERFDLDPTRPYRQLSSGNRRKVGIVQAFMHRPELLILDEPTSGLDPLLQFEFHKLVREAVQDGATVLLSSHVLPEVEQLADRVAILRKGKVVKLGTMGQLRRQARQRIDVYFDQKVDPKPFRLIPEVVEATTVNRTVRLVVEGTVERVLRTAARLHAHRIVSPEADLEDVFLSYYEGRDK